MRTFCWAIFGLPEDDVSPDPKRGNPRKAFGFHLMGGFPHPSLPGSYSCPGPRSRRLRIIAHSCSPSNEPCFQR